jgi:hypothetical protein
MGKFRIVPSKSDNDSDIASHTSVGKSKNKDTGRRLEDSITSKGLRRKLNLDRRVIRNERRVNLDPHYKGAARRFTVDTRANQKDRRDKG